MSLRSWIIEDSRNKKLKLELWSESISARFITPSIEGRKSVHRFVCEGRPIETFKFYFNIDDLLWLKRCLGEAIRELRIRYKTYKRISKPRHRVTNYTYDHPDKAIVERAGSTAYTKIYFMKSYRTTTFFCNLKSLVRFRRKVSDTIIDIMLTKKIK